MTHKQLSHILTNKTYISSNDVKYINRFCINVTFMCYIALIWFEIPNFSRTLQTVCPDDGKQRRSVNFDSLENSLKLLNNVYIRTHHRIVKIAFDT